MAMDAVISRISDIEARLSTLSANPMASRSGIMGQGIVYTPADGPRPAAETNTTSATTMAASTSASTLTGTSSDFSTSLAQSLQAAGIDTSAVSGVTGEKVIAKAMEWVGTPYLWGGNTRNGVDCSGLVKEVLAEFGIDMPRVARDQGREGTKVNSLDEAKAGDLLVFDGGTHIGFYIGNGKMIDSPKPGDHVRVRDVYKTPTAIRRVIPEQVNNASLAQASMVSPTSVLQSSYGLANAADLINMNASSRTSFDLMSTLAGLGVNI